MWDDPEKRQEKRLFRIGKNAAYAIGGGLGSWFMGLVYPHTEEGNRIAAMFGPLGWLLIIYGVIMLAFLVLKKNFAPAANFLFIAFVIPAGLFYIFVTNWPVPHP